MKRFLSIVAALALIGCTQKAPVDEPNYVLNSPSGNLTLSFILSDGRPMYALQHKGTDVILPSQLGFQMRGNVISEQLHYNINGSISKSDREEEYSLADGFEIIDYRWDSCDEIWEPVWGEESQIRNHYNEVLVCLLQRRTGYKMDIRFRLFDDGLGFRYEFPSGQPRTNLIIKEELTQFAMASDYFAWWIPGDYDTQEYEYGECPLSKIRFHFKEQMRGNSSQTPFSTSGVQTSLQMKSPEGLYVNIHEAALVDYPCMHLLVDGRHHSLQAHLTPDAKGWKGFLQTPAKTPWRTVQVAESAEEQLASRLVLNLNEPCALEDVSWIHPTKYMGVWWEMITNKSTWAYSSERTVDIEKSDYSLFTRNENHAANNQRVKEYIDFASLHGFDALLVEGWNIGWEDWVNSSKEIVFDFQTPNPDFDIAELNDYAHSKGLKLIMHHETSGSTRNYERYMEDAYTLMNRYGYDAVKSGYVGDMQPRGEYHYSQSMVNHYLYAVKQAAKHHIMVNAHEAVRPTGLCRTYPNLIGNESAMGTEYQAFGGIQPKHTTILPFTRLNGGPMDYTPGIFEPDLRTWAGTDSYANVTICNQLGLYLTMYSPLQMACDTPENYSRFLDAFQFIKDVAIDWSESRYLAAEPGDYIIVARKSKSDGKWFCGGVTDENAREFDIDLGFLPEGSFEATIYTDAPDAHYKTNPQAYNITRKSVTASDSLHIRMAEGGGFAISFK